MNHTYVTIGKCISNYEMETEWMLDAIAWLFSNCNDDTKTKIINFAILSQVYFLDT